MGSERTYMSFLLRLYRVEHEGRRMWYALLEDPMTGTQYRFPDLDSLFAFLHAVLREESPPPSAHSDPSLPE